jgi:hypothetical protein
MEIASGGSAPPSQRHIKTNMSLRAVFAKQSPVEEIASGGKAPPSQRHVVEFEWQLANSIAFTL